MCGIYGFAGEGSEEQLEHNLQVIYHRGPDDKGYFLDTEVKAGLGMTRLSVIDLSTGHQPLFNETGRLVIVFNGEIYNYRGLRKLLREKGHRFKTGSDTEVILHGYEEYGAGILEKLRGMFAFAIWDKEKKEFFCARDRFGIKPFYYRKTSRGFYFASEQKQLLDTYISSPEIDRGTLCRSLVVGFNIKETTFFKGISQLLPGHYLMLKNNTVTIRRYYTLEAQEDLGGRSEKELIKRLKDLLYASVSEHLESDVPVALTLSGGLDSSVLARIMCDIKGEAKSISSMQAYTVGYGAENDETPYAKMVTDYLNIPLKVRTFSPEALLTGFPKLVRSLEEPLSNITLFTASCWARFIAEERKVTLIGEGADEIFGGYFQYRLFSGLFSFLPRCMQAYGYRYLFLMPPLDCIVRLMGGDSIAREETEEAYRLYQEELYAHKNGLQAIQRFDIAWELSNNQLLRVDRMSMAHSLEARVPFLDHRLVEFAYALPEKMKIRNGVQKYLLRKAFEGELPEEVLYRPKVGKKGSQSVSQQFFKEGLGEKLQNLATDWDGGVVLDKNWGKTMEGTLHYFPPLIAPRIRQKLLYFIYCLSVWEKEFLER